jgi:crotonobetainyl-CoA:carnitine CoA-transferase CaiB-like acyl-CoA transferase
VGFLDGIRVVDTTRLLPGGFCTMLLSDMGAEVIKVEQPGLGDYMRATPPTKDNRSPVHATVNRNKLSIGINLKAEEGKHVLRKLLREADVFVEGFRPGVMKRLGFSFEAVRRISPKIVYCAISAYGQSSRLSSMPGHDINFQAAAGTLGYSRRAEVPLLQLSDMVSGTCAALAIAGALVGRKGAVFVDVPIVSSLLSWMVLPASTYLATGRSPKEGDSLIFGSTPYYNLYNTSDGRYIAVAAIEQEFWHNLMEAVGARELEHKRFGTIKERREVTSELRRIFASRTRDEWASLLMDKDTCATPVLSVEEALTSSWAKAASMLVEVAGDGTVINSPISSRPKMRSPSFTAAPSLGKDTSSLMISLGYSKKDLARLRRLEVVE